MKQLCLSYRSSQGNTSENEIGQNMNKEIGLMRFMMEITHHSRQSDTTGEFFALSADCFGTYSYSSFNFSPPFKAIFGIFFNIYQFIFLFITIRNKQRLS